jgi:hypothetical protein
VVSATPIPCMATRLRKTTRHVVTLLKGGEIATLPEIGAPGVSYQSMKYSKTLLPRSLTLLALISLGCAMVVLFGLWPIWGGDFWMHLLIE